MSEKGSLFSPLTHAQQGILAELLTNPGCLHYNLPLTVEFPLEADAERLKSLIDEVLNARDTLKTVFFQNDKGEIVQYADQSIKYETRIERMEEDDIDTFIREFIQPFDIFHGPLVRSCIIITSQRLVVIIDSLHIISDGITMMNLVQDISDLSHGKSLEPEIESMFEHAEKQKQYDSSAEHDEITRYYKDIYSQRELKRIAPDPVDAMGDAIECTLSIDSSHLLDFCEKNNVKYATLLNAAYCILISCLTRSNTASFATLLHGRDRKTRKTYGSFISTIPFLVDIDPEESVLDFCSKVAKEFISLIRRKDYSFVDFVKTTSCFPETIFTYQGPKIRNELEVDGFQSRAHQIRYSPATNSPLSLAVYEIPGGLELCGECSCRRHDMSFVKKFLQCYADILETIATYPETKVRNIALSKEYGKAQHMETATGDILETIAANAKAFPGRTAILADGVATTYGQLQAQAEAYARKLDSEGCGSFVILDTERSSSTIAAMLGTMISGRAYVPVGSDLPQDRRNWIIQNCCNSITPPNSNRIAYILYTSGSTGKPKGVVISRNALNTFVSGISQVLDISSNDRILCHSSFSFDASIEDIFPVLCKGGELHIISEETRRNPSAIADYITENGITGGNYTTRLASILIDNYELPSLRYIVFGGEKMQKVPARNPHTRIFNTYGPTEFTVDATYFELERGRQYEDIPIGHALPGQYATIADHNGNPLPDGMTGEIILGGAQLAEGYHALPELTGERFIVSSTHPFGRYYRSGDLGYRDSDGEIHFVSRDDRQVKVSGFRIELSEIDKTILAINGVRDAISVVNDNAICSYYSGGATPEEMRKIIANTLPPYMVPRSLIQMESLPAGHSGKIDISALPKPQFIKGEMCPPENREEALLLDIVQEVLHTEEIGVTDDLSLLGLSSIQTLEILSRADNAGIHIDISEAFSCHTIRSILSCRRHMEHPFWFRKDDSKPLAVVVCGITSESEMADLMGRIAENHSVWTIPPVSDSGKNAEQLVEEWMETMPGIPELVCGHSFGGELAYMMAKRINELHGTSPELIMIDTTCSIPCEISEKALESSLVPHRVKLYLSLHDNSHTEGYSGKITLYSARKRDDDFKMLPSRYRKHLDSSTNESLWKKRHSGIKIVGMNDGHDNIMKKIISILSVILFCIASYAQEYDYSDINYELDTLTIVSYKTTAQIVGHASSSLKVDLKKISRMPSMLGQPDPLKFVTLFPGVSSTSEIDSGIHIQGCENGQNDISIEGVPIYGASHLFGLFSVFNPDHFNGMVFSPKAGMQSGRIGGIINMNLPSSVPERINAVITPGLIASSASLSVPLGKKSMIQFSGRKSYLTPIMGGQLNIDGQLIKYDFDDYNLTWLWRGKKDMLRINAYEGLDKLNIDKSTNCIGLDMDWGNICTSGQWVHNFDNGSILDQTVFWSRFHNTTTINNDIHPSELPSHLQTIGYNGMWKSDIFNIIAKFLYHDCFPQNYTLGDNQKAIETITGIEKILNWGMLTVDLEAALHGFKESNTEWRTDISPKMSINYNFGEWGKLGIDVGYFQQYLYQTGMSKMSFPVNYWYLSDNELPGQKEILSDLTHEVEIKNGMFSLSTQLFYKRLYNQLEFTADCLDFIYGQPNISTSGSYGDGRSYGLGLMLSKNAGDLTGWISYSLGRSIRRFDGLYDDEWVLSEHDRTHEFNAVISYEKNRWTYSGVIIAASGVPFTSPDYYYMTSGIYITQFGKHNSHRLTPYFRLDVSASRNLISKPHFEMDLNLSITNLTGRENALHYALSEDWDTGNLIYKPLVMGFTTLPSFSLICKIK